MTNRCRPGNETDSDAVLRINRDATPEVSVLDDAYFSVLRAECAHYSVIEVDGLLAGYLFAMSSSAAYDGEEFLWFREHCERPYYYIDQVAVAREYRGRGLGMRLYKELEAAAARAGSELLTCEVNYEPFNAASQAFHKCLGFEEVGRLAARGFTVSLLQKVLMA